MPEMPVTIDVGDSRLSQIKGWKIAAETSQRDDHATTTERQRRKASLTEKSNKTQDNEATATSQETCRLVNCLFLYAFYYLVLVIIVFLRCHNI
jgi:hypothetical protein